MPVTMLGFKLQSIQVLHAAQRYTGYDNTVRITGKFHKSCSVHPHRHTNNHCSSHLREPHQHPRVSLFTGHSNSRRTETKI